MNKFKIGEEVIWFDKEGKNIATGMIKGVKYTSPLGNIYKVDINYDDKDTVGIITKNIHGSHLKKIKK